MADNLSDSWQGLTNLTTKPVSTTTPSDNLSDSWQGLTNLTNYSTAPVVTDKTTTTKPPVATGNVGNSDVSDTTSINLTNPASAGDISSVINTDDLNKLINNALSESTSESDLNNWKDNQTSLVNDQASNLNTMAADTKDTTLSGLSNTAKASTNVSSEILNSISNSANNLYEALLKQYGGGSTAASIASGASRALGQNTSQITTNRDQQARDILTKQAAAEATYQTQLKQIDNWKTQQVDNLASQINEWLMNINLAKGSIRSSMVSDAITSAQQYLTKIALQQEEYKNALNVWKTEKTGSSTATSTFS